MGCVDGHVNGAWSVPLTAALRPTETPLTLTAKLKSPSRVILTLVNGGALVDYRTVEGATALHKAVERNNFEALKTLLGEIGKRGREGRTPRWILG